MTRTPNCLSEVRFSALLQYAPQGQSEASQASREAVVWIKRDTPAYVERIGVRCAECAAEGRFADLFGPDVVLVPIPRSEPLRSGTLWPALRIAEELLRRGLGAEVRPMLVRREATVKSALQRSAGSRPGPLDHVRTIAVNSLPLGIRRVVLVDDVVTRGATLLGCASVLAQASPSLEVRCFAAVRTMSDQEIETMLSPVCGKITLSGERLHRHP